MHFERLLKKLSIYLTITLFAFGLFAMFYTGEYLESLIALKTIMLSPSPLVTDYFALGNLSSAFLNAGLCSLFCAIFINLKHARLNPSVYAGYFLVIAHCFYGLSFFNMLPCAIAAIVAAKIDKRRIRRNISTIFFTTAFGPFAGELILRYPFGNIFLRTIATFFFSLLMAYCVPLALDETKRWHQGYNLYNGGLALGLWGVVFYAFFYKTLGVEQTGAIYYENAIYDMHGRSYFLFANIFFITIFLSAILIGYHCNNNSFAGYLSLLKEDSYKSDYSKLGDAALVLINLGFYGLLILGYFDLVIIIFKGAGFTGSTVGAILASLSFTASGQQPRNAIPILIGYVVLYLLANLLSNGTMGWTLASQGYINGAAFATGLCPIAGVYGPICGILAGMIDAIICTSTSAMHGGLMLYNGGLTAGLTALLVLPIFEYFRIRKKTTEPTD